MFHIFFSCKMLATYITHCPGFHLRDFCDATRFKGLIPRAIKLTAQMEVEDGREVSSTVVCSLSHL